MTLLDEALAQIPGYVDPKATVARMQRLMLGLSGLQVSKAFEASVDRVNSLMYTSEDPQEVIEAQRVRVALYQDTQIAKDLADQVRGRIREVKTEAFVDETDAGAALTWLHNKLTTLLGAAKTASTALGSITTINEAIHGTDEQLKAWRTLDDLAAEYDAIRKAQYTISREMCGFRADGDRTVLDLLRMHGEVRNAFDTSTAYLSKRFLPQSATEWKVQDAEKRAKWRHVGVIHNITTEAPFWEAHTSPADLLTIAKQDNSWVPTLEQLRTVGKAIEQMLKKIDGPYGLRPALDAHDAYYRDRGIKPKKPLDTDAYRAELPESRNPRRGGRRADEPGPTDMRLARYF